MPPAQSAAGTECQPGSPSLWLHTRGGECIAVHAKQCAPRGLGSEPRRVSAKPSPDEMDVDRPMPGSDLARAFCRRVLKAEPTNTSCASVFFVSLSRASSYGWSRSITHALKGRDFFFVWLVERRDASAQNPIFSPNSMASTWKPRREL